LIGDISVSLSSQALTSPLSSPLQSSKRTLPAPLRKPTQATFLFFGLLTGEYTAHIRSNLDLPDRRPPYYLPADVSLNVANPPFEIPSPNPVWPAFPDIRLADSSKRLDDPTQNPVYRAQRLAATLQPSRAYPFPIGSTLLRGTVFANGAPLAGATVRRRTDEQLYLTGDDGEFIFFFTQLSGIGETITLQATHGLHPTVQQTIDVHRGMTVATTIVMAP
jgi:hypothetical protein